ncbi:MAG TPA: hypothetical protein DGT23_12145 [Micromonosporaceae bacterium]|nr:hypothetical protein [Micromonosporaceae bacterium]
MADTEDTTPADGDGQPPRDSTSGRYASRHQPKGEGDSGEPAPKDEKEGKKRWLLLLLLLLILLLLICAGAAYMRWWRKDDPNPSATPTAISTTATTKPTPTATASPTASPSPSVSPSPKTVAMPNVVGKPAAEAKTILEAAGLGNIKFVAEDKPEEGLSLLVSYVVTKQSVAAGTQVPVDTAVVITCKSSSNGKG